MRELTPRELDVQLAEQLPARELMGIFAFSKIVVAQNGNYNGNYNGNTVGSAISALNGNLNGNLDGNSLVINVAVL
jgi:hypothetical protein